MRTRWLVALGVAVSCAVAGGQELPPLPPAAPTLPPREPPGSLPPLLPVPDAPMAEVPRPGPGGVEYDHGYSYLPEYLPERPRRAPPDVCGPPGKWWVAPSLELAWVPTRPAPAVVRLRVPTGDGGTVAGPVLPVAGRSAGRFEAALGLVGGWWFGDTNTHGVEATFFTRDADSTFAARFPGGLVVFPRGTQREAQVIAFPAGAAPLGAATFPVTLGTEFTTVDVSYRHKLLCSDRGRLDWLAGYRYAFLGDEVYLGDPPGDHDEYRWNRAAVSNAFHAGQVGVAGEVRGDRWYVSGSAKVAFGVLTSKATTAGAFVGLEGLSRGEFRRLGALAAAESSEFAVMPTLDVRVGRQLSDHMRLFAGYSFQYLSRAARLGDALNPAAGGLTFAEFWVQSIGLGAEFRF
jgi:hypothetical protein